MTQLSGFPYFEIEFSKSGVIHEPGAAAQLLQFIKERQTTDLLVFSHGWNNDMAEAGDLYQRYFLEFRKVVDAGVVQLGARNVVILGVLWPSKKFAEDDLIPGGGANLQGSLEAVVRRQLERLDELSDDDQVKRQIADAKSRIGQLQDELQARRAVVQAAKAVIRSEQKSDDEDDGADDILVVDDLDLIARLEAPSSILAPPKPDAGGAATIGMPDSGPSVAAAGIGDFLSGAFAAANRLLNYTTYYAMKERAGQIGKKGLAPLLIQCVAQAPTLKIHLVGHSFGGRLVTAAANSLPDGPNAHLRTLLLLQAAFSHHGFSDKFRETKTGFFRKVISGKKVNGPVIVTHTANDRAVGLAYAIASRIARDDAAALGDAADRYGGIGRNGAQKTDEAVSGKKLRNESLALESGRIHNLLADDVIRDHSDVCSPATARILLESICSSV